MKNSQIIKQITDKGIVIPTDIKTKAQLSAFAKEQGVELVEPEGADEEADAAADLADADDIAWRVAQGLTYPQAMEASRRQREHDATLHS